MLLLFDKMFEQLTKGEIYIVGREYSHWLLDRHICSVFIRLKIGKIYPLDPLTNP